MKFFKSLATIASSLAAAFVSTAKGARKVSEGRPTDNPRVALASQIVNSIRHRPLTGLEIRAVRMSKSLGRGRSRSKYVPNRIPARVTKLQKRIATGYGMSLAKLSQVRAA